MTSNNPLPPEPPEVPPEAPEVSSEASSEVSQGTLVSDSVGTTLVSDAPGRPLWIGLCVGFLVLLAALGWWRMRIDSSLEPLLPQTSEARKTLAFLRDSTFSTKAVLWLKLTDDSPRTLDDLFTLSDELAARLDPQLVRRVIQPPREADAIEEAIGLLDHAGELLGEDQTRELESLLTPDALAKRMRANYLTLLKPEGSFFQPILRRDPLGISTQVLSRLTDLTAGLSYRVEVKQGRLIHPDGRQMMMVLETASSATSLDGSAALTEHLESLAAMAPPGIVITPIAGQIHTAQNHQTMHWDLQRAGAINAVAFLLLFLAIRRDWRVVAVFVLPIVTVLTTVGICSLLFDRLSLVVIGMTSTMVGSAVDYGIFVYIARCVSRGAHADMRRIRRTLLISHMTALGVFASFLFSDIPAYRQLGCLTTVSLVFSLLGALYVLPWLLGDGGPRRQFPQGIGLIEWGRLTWPVTLLALAALPVMIYLASQVGFDSDITRFDGITDEVRQNEKDFHHTWSRTDTEMAMLVVRGATRDEADQANDRALQAVQGRLAQGAYVSLASFWPSAATRQANQARWRAFWSEQRITQLRIDLAEAGKPYGFSPRAFEPFFASLTQPPPSDADRPRVILDSLEEQFVARAGDDWLLLNYFEDTPQNVAALRQVVRDWPEAQVVSRLSLSQTFIESAIAESRLMVSVSVGFILLSLAVMTRRLMRAVAVILPAVLGLLTMFTVMALMALPINVVTIVACIVVLAVSIDYGVFSLHAWQGRETMLGQGMAAVHLSSWITLVATGSLLIADHPAMFIVGVSLTTGLAAAYFAATMVMPGLYYLVERRRAAKPQGETP